MTPLSLFLYILAILGGVSIGSIFLILPTYVIAVLLGVLKEASAKKKAR